MSYEKVKSIVRVKKEGKIFITSASNNCHPITYYRWEFMKEEQDYHKKELELMRTLMGDSLQLNFSMYEWNYAKIRTNEEMSEKYGQELYELTLNKSKRYVLGRKIRTSDIEITADEVKGDKYLLKYEYKDGTKEYRDKVEYEQEEKRIKDFMEEYYNTFIKYLESPKMEVYLVSDTLGFIEPKGTRGAFYYGLKEPKIMDFKKAYCFKSLFQNQGRNVEIKEIKSRKYVATEEQKAESKERLRYLGVTDNTENYKAINEQIGAFEEKYKALVYHIIESRTEFGYLYNMFYVTSEQEVWKEDKEDLKEGYACVYVYNEDCPDCSEIGTISFKKEFNRIRRVS